MCDLKKIWRSQPKKEHSPSSISFSLITVVICGVFVAMISFNQSCNTSGSMGRSYRSISKLICLIEFYICFNEVHLSQSWSSQKPITTRNNPPSTHDRSRIQLQKKLQKLHLHNHNDNNKLLSGDTSIHTFTGTTGTSTSRRKAIVTASSSLLSLLSINLNVAMAIQVQNGQGKLFEIQDPNTYSALVYIPKSATTSTNNNKRYPVIIVLHGAGQNTIESTWNIANPNGEHAGLIPSLLYSNRAPSDLYENFIVIAPYSFGKTSFYDEPRSRTLQFVTWACSIDPLVDIVDPKRLFLFGFSDGATLGVELMTTSLFAGGVFAAYGFTGTLPPLALERLKGKPMWIFHSADDVIFDVKATSDKLVKSLRLVNNSDDSGIDKRQQIIRYTRFDVDQEGFTGSVRGHSTGITASKDAEVYKWLLNLQ